MRKKINRDRTGRSNHALRDEMMLTMDELGPMSPVQLAKLLDEGLSQVSYHMNVLRDTGCVKLVRTEPRRGAVEHFYKLKDGVVTFDADEVLKEVAALCPQKANGALGQIREILQETGHVPGKTQ